MEELRNWVGEQLSPIAKPDDIRFTDNLPKTRSGKIMRRLLRAIARGEEITQDMSTLENPAILDQLRGGRTAAAPAERAASQVAAPVNAPSKPSAPSPGETQAAQGLNAARQARKGRRGPSQRKAEKVGSEKRRQADRRLAQAAAKSKAVTSSKRRAQPAQPKRVSRKAWRGICKYEPTGQRGRDEFGRAQRPMPQASGCPARYAGKSDALHLPRLGF